MMIQTTPTQQRKRRRKAEPFSCAFCLREMSDPKCFTMVAGALGCICNACVHVAYDVVTKNQRERFGNENLLGDWI